MDDDCRCRGAAHRRTGAVCGGGVSGAESSDVKEARMVEQQLLCARLVRLSSPEGGGSVMGGGLGIKFVGCSTCRRQLGRIN